MMLTQIVAIDKNGAIGRGNEIPWKIKDDMKWFMANTMGKLLLMGRKTYESIGKPLPGRYTIVLTRDSAAFYGNHPDLLDNNNVFVVTSVSNAIAIAMQLGVSELMVCGGGEIYEQTAELGHTDYPVIEETSIILTVVDTEIEDADTFYLPDCVHDLLLCAELSEPIATSEVNDHNEFAAKYFHFK